MNVFERARSVRDIARFNQVVVCVVHWPSKERPMERGSYSVTMYAAAGHSLMWDL